MAKKDVIKLIQQYEEKLDSEPWTGSLADYLKMVVEEPKLNRSAHEYVRDMVISKGVRYRESDEKKETPIYEFFANDLFGIERVHTKVMQYFKSAAAGSEVARRIVLMFGPTSSGKSQTATLIKEGLEEYSKTMDGRIYSINGCPMQENPLNALPKGIRKKVQEEYGLIIQGDLCPRCTYILENDYDGDIWKIPVKRFFYSEMSRSGIGTFQPADPKSQNQSELVGSVNFGKLEEYGVESHPMAFIFDGELNIGNRGFVEFIELLKVDPKFRYILLTLAQEKRIKAERFPLIYADLVPFAHTNETEYNKFLAKEDEEALHDRLWVIKSPYNLSVSDEIKIYNKLVASVPEFKNIHIAPHTFEMAAMFAILSRLVDPKDKKITLVQKMHLFDDKQIDGISNEESKTMMEENERDGMIGVSPRYIVNRLSACFTIDDKDYINPIDAIRSIVEGFETNAKLTNEDIDHFEQLISECVNEYDKIALNEVQKAFFVNFETEIQTLLKNYLENAEAYLEGGKVKNEFGDYDEPDERLMRNIEEKIDVTETGKKTFRAEVVRKMLRAQTDGEYDYSSHPKLKEGLEQQLFDERKDTIRLTVSTRNPDPDELRRKNEVLDTLVDKYGYTVGSANSLLRYVDTIMKRSGKAQ